MTKQYIPKDFGIAIYNSNTEEIRVFYPILEGGFNLNEDGTLKEWVTKSAECRFKEGIHYLGPIEDESWENTETNNGI